MKFDCFVAAQYEIPDNQLRKVVKQFKKDWAGEAVELFPTDLIRTARRMGIGTLEIDDDKLECDDAPLREDELPK